MSLRFLLDTDALSEPLKPKPNARFLRRLREHEEHVAIASVTWHEALYGLHRLPAGKRQQQVYGYLFDVIHAALPILPYDAAAAEWHAAERARLGAAGRTAPFADGQIAAVAKVHGLAIVTANRAHYEHFDGMTLDDWWR